ncbi:Nitrilase [Penicillium macrosclerotiorum]|uniref:Nitrilase n=1 Tax=Penicillium macrosclerotiorum TaxID=303699 RepID=UPI00254836AC|nr:Nitrilase [Penicillium macrosclerotiorum]KAJ5698494.1 Nitrilase [Penicillium macrosclerotiorum]
MAQIPVHGDPAQPVKAAVVQAEPCWFDLDAATDKTCALIAEAASNGAQVIGFPELWIPGYPTFIFGHKANDMYDYCLKYYRHAVDVTSEQMNRIRSAARAGNIMVILGIAERDKGSLFMAQVFIGPDGNILLHRRKFKPTSLERVVFGDASGDCTTNVVQTPIGRIGGLQCFEHLQPLLKYHSYFQGEQIHVASWPMLFPPVGKGPFFNTVDACRMATHVYAIEGGAFVLLASHTQGESGLKANGLIMPDQSQDTTPHVSTLGGGFSQIIAPDGRSLTEPVDPTFEGLLYADLDFNEIYYAKNIVDPVGQYSRTDLFTLQVDNRVKRHCVYKGEENDAYKHASRYPDLKSEEVVKALEST